MTTEECQRLVAEFIVHHKKGSWETDLQSISSLLIGGNLIAAQSSGMGLLERTQADLAEWIKGYTENEQEYMTAWLAYALLRGL